MELNASGIKKNRCGEVFFENEKLQYYCLFCNQVFDKVLLFTNHLYEEHLYLDPPSLLNEIGPSFEFENINSVSVYDDTDQIKLEEEMSEPELNPLLSNQHDNFFMFREERLITIDNPNLKDSFKSKYLTDNHQPKNDQNRNCGCDCETASSIDNASQISLNKLMRTHFHTTEDPVPSTASTTEPISHRLDFPKSNDNLYHCNLCSNTYNRIDSIRNHHLREHGSGEDRTCKICNKQLSSKQNLIAHMMVHTGERPYQCTYCPSAFANRTNFDRHVRMHLGDKRYACEYCGKKFVQRCEKKIHEKMVHTKERSYQCEICGQKFYNNASLSDHKKRHTDSRPFECDICNKKFYNKKLLEGHKISHSNERPFECKLCSAKFSRKKALVQHSKIHTQIKAYICTICNKGFAQNAGLYSHMKCHTGPTPPSSVSSMFSGKF